MYQQSVQIVAALIRQEGNVLLVQQQGAEDPQPSWALPGGGVETGELLHEALTREVREETGLEVLDPGRLVYVAHMDQPQAGRQVTAFIFDVGGWTGQVHPVDPDHLILQLRFLTIPETIERLQQLTNRRMWEPIVAYLKGEVPAGAVWLYRQQADGSDRLVTCLS